MVTQMSNVKSAVNENMLTRVEEVYITPEVAKNWLALNHNFRRLDTKRARYFAQQIRHGGWQMNGETIKFDAAGNLIDGQHRLQACVIAGVPFRSLVVWGAISDLHVDTGKPRNFSDVLNSRGESNAHVLAAGLRLLHRHLSGSMRSVSIDTKASHGQYSRSLRRTRKSD